MEGSVIIERKDANAKFYGRPVSAKELLSGAVDPPSVADSLYAALYARASPELATSSSSASAVPPPSSPPPPLRKKPTVRPTSLGHAAGAATVNSMKHSNSISMPDPSNYSNNNHTAAPSTVLTPPPPPPPPIPTRPQGETAVAQFDFDGQQDGDLPFKIGDRITILRKTDSQNDWWTGSCNGREGVVSVIIFIVFVESNMFIISSLPIMCRLCDSILGIYKDHNHLYTCVCSTYVIWYISW